MVKVFLEHDEHLTADRFWFQVAKFGKTLSDDFKEVMKSVDKQVDVIVGLKPTKQDILEIYEEVYAQKHDKEGFSVKDLKTLIVNFVNRAPANAPASEKKRKQERASAGLSAPSSSGKPPKRRRTKQPKSNSSDDDDGEEDEHRT